MSAVQQRIRDEHRRYREGRLIRHIDRGVEQWKARMGGQPTLAGHRLTMRHLQRMTRKEMMSWPWLLTGEEADNVIRYWAVRGFTKVR